MSIFCKLFGHRFDYELKGTLFCTRCAADIDVLKIAERNMFNKINLDK
jgi:hypothetical protein